MNVSRAPISPATWFSAMGKLAAGCFAFAKMSFCSLRAGKSRFRNQLGVIMPVLVACVLTGFVFVNVRQAEWKRAQLVFERQSSDISDSLLANIGSYLEVMYSTESFFLANPSVDRNAFHLFTRGLLARHPGIQALEWIPAVPGKKRSSYEDAARNDGFSQFQIAAQDSKKKLVPAPSKDEYFPVYYVEPYGGNEKALGYDLSTNPARLEALEKARDLGAAIATSRLMLVQETGTQSSVLLFLPVYSTGSVPGDIPSRRRSLKGFIVGVFRIGDIVATALRPFNQRDIAIDLLDKSAPYGEQLLFTSRARPFEAATSGAVEKGGWEALFHLHDFEVGGRKWSIVCSPTASYRANLHLWEAWAVLMGGLFFSVMLGAFLLVVIGQSAATECIVVVRTAELSQLNRELSRLNLDLEKTILIHKQMEDELQSATERANGMAKQAQAANEAKSDFIANMSHELRTPLNVIIGFTELILDKQCGDLTPLQEEYLGDVGQSARNLFLLINDILDLTKIETGDLELELTEINLPELLSRSLTILREKALKHNIELSCEEEEGTPATIVADERKVKHIIYNLLANAVKFTPDGGRVRMKTQCCEGLLEVFIEDSGIGMKREDLQRIFDPFEQVESSRSRRFPGAGVGLYLAKSMVELHGGTIWAESEGEGRGSRFCFVMPTMPSN
ncbi:MAG: CHASE domain-containing protein [Syntrophobacteraceae bacterium]|nr:CHASE domain-containing protein [Syntrophobacteraceae bacterium]